MKISGELLALQTYESRGMLSGGLKVWTVLLMTKDMPALMVKSGDT